MSIYASTQTCIYIYAVTPADIHTHPDIHTEMHKYVHTYTYRLVYIHINSKQKKMHYIYIYLQTFHMVKLSICLSHTCVV